MTAEEWEQWALIAAVIVRRYWIESHNHPQLHWLDESSTERRGQTKRKQLETGEDSVRWWMIPCVFCTCNLVWQADETALLSTLNANMLPAQLGAPAIHLETISQTVRTPRLLHLDVWMKMFLFINQTISSLLYTCPSIPSVPECSPSRNPILSGPPRLQWLSSFRFCFILFPNVLILPSGWRMFAVIWTKFCGGKRHPATLNCVSRFWFKSGKFLSQIFNPLSSSELTYG